MRLYDDRPSGTVTRALALRRDVSPIERSLLRALRETYAYLKWRHQAPIGPYYADILCFSEKLVIEVDGDTHAASTRYDADRSAFIGAEGYRTIRFANTDVVQNLEGVIASLSLSLREKEVPKARKDGGDRTMKKGIPA